MTSLYMPPQFDCRDIALAQALLREYPLAQLVSVSAAGEPFVSPLPLETLTEGFALSGIPAEKGGDEQGGDEEGGGGDIPRATCRLASTLICSEFPPGTTSRYTRACGWRR